MSKWNWKLKMPLSKMNNYSREKTRERQEQNKNSNNNAFESDIGVTDFLNSFKNDQLFRHILVRQGCNQWGIHFYTLRNRENQNFLFHYVLSFGCCQSHKCGNCTLLLGSFSNDDENGKDKVIKTVNEVISRCCFAEDGTDLFISACLTCSTLTRSTNQILNLRRCRCRSRRWC